LGERLAGAGKRGSKYAAKQQSHKEDQETEPGGARQKRACNPRYVAAVGASKGKTNMKLMFTHRSAENAKYIYYANVIRDEARILNGKPCYLWFGDGDNDVDGTPYWHKDPAGQPGTRWTYQGKPINGDIIPFIVVPPQVINMTPEIVGGCIGTMEWNGKDVPCVVGDSGPLSKIGEASPAALRALGLPALENGNGGLDEQAILYRIWPGVAARLEIDGKIYQFELQHS
jgi:hypothetical protein